MNPTMIDVLIIGAGPTGSVLAVDLARRGISVRIIDRNAQSFPGSRAKGIQPRTLEVLYDLGMLDEILAAGSLYPPLGIHLGPLTIPKRMYKKQAATAGVPYPDTFLIPQYRTDKIIHDRLAQFGVQVEFSSKLVLFDQNNNEVQAKIEGPKGPETISCKFMVGSDGGASTVRQNLGIDFPGKTEESDRMIIVDSKVEGLSQKYWHIWPGLRGRFVGACPLPGGELFQWMIRLKPGEEPNLDESGLNKRVHQHTRSKKIRLYDIQWTSVFRPNIRLAELYAKGRIFIAGDAAHVHTLMGAQGLNTGTQDAYNLGWKLAQVISGAPRDLLDSYEAERQPIAAGVLGLSTKKYEALGKLDPSSINRGKDEQQLSISYRFGPLAAQDAEFTRTLHVGDRAPDAEVLDRDKQPLRLFEVLRGPQFSLLAFGPKATQDLSQIAWPVSGAPLKRVAIDAGQGGGADVRLEDDKSSFRAIYGLDKDTLLLVRPDGYIGQIATRNRVAAISIAASAMTSLGDATSRAAPELQ